MSQEQITRYPCTKVAVFFQHMVWVTVNMGENRREELTLRQKWNPCTYICWSGILGKKLSLSHWYKEPAYKPGQHTNQWRFKARAAFEIVFFKVFGAAIKSNLAPKAIYYAQKFFNDGEFLSFFSCLLCIRECEQWGPSTCFSLSRIFCSLGRGGINNTILSSCPLSFTPGSHHHFSLVIPYYQVR